MKTLKQLTTNSLFSALVLLLGAAFTVTACSDDELKIDGNKVSSVSAEFGMLRTNSLAQTVGFTTDNDEYIQFYEPQSISGAVADTTYRALVYYYTFADIEAYGLYAFTLVGVCPPVDESVVGEMKTDPVYSPEIWISNNNSYINIAFNVYSYNDNSAHGINIVKSIDADKGNMTTLTLYHDQNSIPEYYLATLYVSIPIKGYFQSGEPVNIVINTYEEGVKETIINIPDLYTGSSELYY